MSVVKLCLQLLPTISAGIPHPDCDNRKALRPTYNTSCNIVLHKIKCLPHFLSFRFLWRLSAAWLFLITYTGSWESSKFKATWYAFDDIYLPHPARSFLLRIHVCIVSGANERRLFLQARIPDLSLYKTLQQAVPEYFGYRVCCDGS